MTVEEITQNYVNSLGPVVAALHKAIGPLNLAISISENCVAIGMPEDFDLTSQELLDNLILLRDQVLRQIDFVFHNSNYIAFTLRHSANSAYHISDLVYPIPPEEEPIMQTKASKVAQGITFIADVEGEAGNSIAISFDGILTLDTSVNIWNSANPDNTVSYSGKAGTIVPTVEVVTLEGAVDLLAPPADFAVPAVI